MHLRIEQSVCTHLLLQSLAILAFTAHFTSSQNAAAPPALNLSPEASSSASLAPQCPVSVQYNVNLGQGQDTALVPIFVATITITNNQQPLPTGTSPSTSPLPLNSNVTIQSWRMGWQFPFNSTLKTPEDVFDPWVVLLTPDSVTPVLETVNSTNNNSTASSTTSGIGPGESRKFGFLGTKGTGPLSASNPYNVGAVTGMVFNNLLCTMISSPHQQLPPFQPPQQQQLAAPDATPGEAVAGPTQLEIQYTPIQYRDEPLINTFTQFLVRVRNTGNGFTINLDSIGFQYWFQGPEGFLPPSVETSPWDYFEARCEWATLGCDSVKLGISTGFMDVYGARFALNVSLTENATGGPLLPSGAAAVPALFLGQQGIDVLDLLLTITTKAGVVLLNSTQDYSFLDTPILAETLQQQQQQQQQRLNATTGNRNGTGVLVPRKAQPNKKIPAYIDGQLAWGILPSPSPSKSLQTAPAPELERGQQQQQLPSGSGEPLELPEGVFCESIRGGAEQSCTLQAVYCCVSVDPQQPGVSATVPAVWPPKSSSGGGGGGNTQAGTNTPTSTTAPNNSPNSTSSSGTITSTVPQEESSTTTFFPPLPEPGTQNQLIAGTEQQQQTSSGGGSVVWVAGIAVGVAAGGIIGGGFFIAWRRQKEKHRQAATAAAEEEETKNMMMLQNGGGIGGGSGSNGNSYPSESPLSWKSGFLPSTTAATGGGSGDNGSVTFAASSGGSPVFIPSAAAHVGGNVLYKYPSGVTGTSSAAQSDPTAVLDSTFADYSTGGNTNTYLPHHSSFDPGLGVVVVGLGSGSGGGYENGNENNESSRQGSEDDTPRGVGPLPSNVLALLERKARTCPGSLFSSSTKPLNSTITKKHHQNHREHRRATESPATQASGEGLGMEEGSSFLSAGGGGQGGEHGGELTDIAALNKLAAASPYPSSSSPSDDEDQEEEGDVFNSNPDIEPWQLRRSTSWDGVLQDPHSSDSFSQVLRLKRRRTAPQQLPAPLPPLSPMPSPLLPALQGPGPGIDLDVDPSEIMGHLGKCLGTGGFGSVFEAEWRGKKVAVKMLPSLAATTDPPQPQQHGSGGAGAAATGDAAYQALLREIQLASKFDSDRLVKVYGACTRDKHHCCLIMELAENGSLFQRIYDRKKRRLSYLEILQLGHDIACGLAYLHPAVVHRDLKPQNVLLDSEGRAKLADFGISRIKDPTKSYFSQVTAENGTPMYMSPESMNGTRVDEKVDVYALGVILNEAWTRRQPWKDSAHFFQIILKVAINGERPWMDPDCPEPLKRLITKCWHQNPRQRPSCADVMRLTDLLMQDELRKYDDFLKR